MPETSQGPEEKFEGLTGLSDPVAKKGSWRTCMNEPKESNREKANDLIPDAELSAPIPKAIAMATGRLDPRGS
jgi:hypothetical protein